MRIIRFAFRTANSKFTNQIQLKNRLYELSPSDKNLLSQQLANPKNDTFIEEHAAIMKELRWIKSFKILKNIFIFYQSQVKCTSSRFWNEAIVRLITHHPHRKTTSTRSTP